MTAPAPPREAAEPDELRAPFGLRPAEATPTRWPLHLLVTGSAGLIATGSAPLLLGGGGATIAAAATLSTAASAGSVTVSVRQQRRHEISHEAQAAVERVAGPVRRFRCHLWRGWFVGSPRLIRFRYHPAAVLTQAWPSAGLSALSSVLGDSYRVSRHDERRGVLTLRRKPTAAQVEVHPVEGRAVELMRQLFGQSATVRAELAGDRLTTVTVAHDCGIKATFGSWRDRVERVVSTMLEGRWRARWDLQADRVTFELRPEIASFLKRSAPLVDPSHPDFYKIPLGVDEDGGSVCWDLASSMPHFLVSGKTGKGKTVVLRGVAMELAARQLKVWLIDPKRVELIALRGWPNVQLVATVIEQQVATIMQAWQVMEDRYQAIEAGASEEDFETLVVILDEFAEFSRRVSQWWTRIKRTGMPSVCPVFEAFDSLVRLGRTAGIRIAIGIQRPDARFFGESAEARDNFDSRLSLGRLSPDGSRMMWGSSIGTALPGVRGRAIACTSEDQASEIQALWVPDPRRMRPDSDPEDHAVLQRLRPATATHPQLRVVIPDPELDDKGRALVWEAINAARVEEVDEPEPLEADDAEAEADDVEDDDEDVEDDDPAPGGRSATIVQFPRRQTVETADDYGPPEETAAEAIQDGDLVLVDDRWVVVESAERDLFDDQTVVVAWRSVEDGTDDDGTETVGRGHLLPRRRPLED